MMPEATGNAMTITAQSTAEITDLDFVIPALPVVLYRADANRPQRLN
jgi:hypothetical protein